MPPEWLEEIGLTGIFGSTAEKMEEDKMKTSFENTYFLTQGVLEAHFWTHYSPENGL